MHQTSKSLLKQWIMLHSKKAQAWAEPSYYTIKLINNLMWLNKIDLAYTGLLVETSPISVCGRLRRPSELMFLTSPSWHSKFVDILSSLNAAVSGSLKLKHSIALFGATSRTLWIIGSSILISKVVSARSIRSTGTCIPAASHDFIQAPWSILFACRVYYRLCFKNNSL